jgi:hypothetical protein
MPAAYMTMAASRQTCSCRRLCSTWTHTPVHKVADVGHQLTIVASLQAEQRGRGEGGHEDLTMCPYLVFEPSQLQAAQQGAWSTIHLSLLQ